MPTHYQDLLVWRKGMDLVHLACLLARRLPPDGREIADDLRESAIAIPARIAAGHNSDQLRRYRRALDAANGKLARTACLLDIGERQGFLAADDPEVVRMRELCAEIGRMLALLMANLRLREPPE